MVDWTFTIIYKTFPKTQFLIRLKPVQVGRYITYRHRPVCVCVRRALNLWVLTVWQNTAERMVQWRTGEYLMHIKPISSGLKFKTQIRSPLSRVESTPNSILLWNETQSSWWIKGEWSRLDGYLQRSSPSWPPCLHLSATLSIFLFLFLLRLRTSCHKSLGSSGENGNAFFSDLDLKLLKISFYHSSYVNAIPAKTITNLWTEQTHIRGAHLWCL